MCVVRCSFILIQACYSQGSQVRFPLRFPLRRVLLSLLPLLPHGSPTLPSPLFPCIVLCSIAQLCCFRPRHLDFTTQDSVTDRCYPHDHIDHCVFEIQSPSLWRSVDENEVLECTVG
jgi:hypothetical protein